MMRALDRALVLPLVLFAALFGRPPFANFVSPQQAAPPAEPSAPQPSSEVQKNLAESAQLAQAKDHDEALKAADRALTAAQQSKDSAGEALSQRARAKAFEELGQKEEAARAWQQAAEAWQSAGDGPGQIEALAAAGLLVARDQPAESKRLLAQALELGKAETNRPIGASQALVDVALKISRARSKPPANSREFFEAALAIQERLQPESPDTIETMNRLGYLCITVFDYKAAEHYLNLALTRGKKVAPDSVTVAHTLDRLGELENYREDFAKSKQYFERAIALKEALVPNSLDLAYTLDRAAITIDTEGDYSQAQKLFQRSLNIREKLDPESTPVADSFNDLAVVARQTGDLEVARSYLNRTLSINERLLGPNSPQSAATRINLGNIADDLGDYATARHEFEHALAIFAKSSPKAYGVPAALASLRSVAYHQGDLTSALEYGERALKLFEEVAPGQLDAAEELSGLGKIYVVKGMFGRAEEYYRRALAIREKRAPESLDLANSYSDLGELALAKGELETAADFQRKALVIGEKTAPVSLDVASILQKLGEISYRQGKFDTALKYHQRSLHIRESFVGSKHPDVARSLISVAEVQATMGDRDSALEAALRAEDIAREHLQNSARSLSERQALSYALTRASGLDLSLSLVVAAAGNPSAAKEVFDSVIRSRALVLDEMAERHHAVHELQDREVAQLAEQLSSARARLATLVVRGPGDAPPDRYKKLLDDARKEKEEGERALAEKSISFRLQQDRSRIGLEGVAAALPPGSALVAFVRYNQHELTPKQEPEKVPAAAVASYLAFVLSPGQDEPQVVRLGAARQVEAEVKKLREEMAREAQTLDTASKRREVAYRAVGRGLRRRVWDPIAPRLKGAKRVFVVPDGALNLVNLATLPFGRASYLLESGPLVHYLSTERDLVPDATEEKGEGLLAFGDPSFDDTSLFATLAPKGMSAETGAPPIAASMRSFRGMRSSCGSFQTLRFDPLPASAREVEEIVSLWNKTSTPKGFQASRLRGAGLNDGAGAVQLTGASASERAFMAQAPGKRVLHLATHGFFLEGPCQSALQFSSTHDREDEALPISAENPLLLSGLAFAGANNRAAARQDELDGILTAEEIAAMDLHGVEWAVLSACDTGAGEIRAGEGLFGLRRAFQIAGARTVIASLWSVEDEATRQWMRALYQYHFRNSMDTAESLRAASLEVLRQRRLKRLSTHPFYWGGFIAAGDWH